MSCNCKNKNNNEVNIPFVNNEEKTPKESLGKLIPIYFVKILGFSLGLLLLPIIMCAIVVFMFRIIVMTREVDVIPLFNSVVKLLRAADDNEDEEEEEEEDNENDVIEYIMVDVDDISKNK